MDRATLAAQARAHWATWLPNKTAALTAAGELNEATQAAATAAQQQITQAVANGAKEHEAMQEALAQHILLTPEPPPEDDWETRELDERENRYQAMMREPEPAHS